MAELLNRHQIEEGDTVECPSQLMGHHQTTINLVAELGVGGTLVYLTCGHEVTMQDGHGLYVIKKVTDQ